MSKAILVLDYKPKICKDCILFRFDSYEKAHYCAGVLGKEVEELDHPDWCPLRLMPEKIQECLEGDEWDEGIMRGWNDCLEAIEGSEEDGRT